MLMNDERHRYKRSLVNEENVRISEIYSNVRAKIIKEVLNNHQVRVLRKDPFAELLLNSRLKKELGYKNEHDVIAA